MAVELFKLVMSGTPSNIRVSPTVNRYFRKYNAVQDKVSNNRLMILASRFLNDNGSIVPSNGIATRHLSNGYYMLFVNGALQQSNLYTVYKSQLLVLSGAAGLPANSPISLVVNNFTPNLDISITS